MKEIINIQGKWYNHLGTWNGKCYLGKIADGNNEVEKEGIIWEMQPFFYQDEVWYGDLLFRWYQIKRWFSNLHTSNKLK